MFGSNIRLGISSRLMNPVQKRISQLNLLPCRYERRQCIYSFRTVPGFGLWAWFLMTWSAHYGMIRSQMDIMVFNYRNKSFPLILISSIAFLVGAINRRAILLLILVERLHLRQCSTLWEGSLSFSSIWPKYYGTCHSCSSSFLYRCCKILIKYSFQ